MQNHGNSLVHASPWIIYTTNLFLDLVNNINLKINNTRILNTIFTNPEYTINLITQTFYFIYNQIISTTFNNSIRKYN